MAAPRPELIFLTGPQRGQRVVLRRDLMLGGRGEPADIAFTEEFVSREQLQFRRFAEGWIVERFPQSNPMRVNGKEYKPGKQILLESGDVIAVGAETELLFVGATDDPHHVLAEYRRDHPETQASPEPVPVPVEAPSPQPLPVEPPAAAAEPMLKKTPKKAEAKPKKLSSSKTKKYFLAFLVYLALLAVGVIVLSQKKDAKDNAEDSSPPRLEAQTMADVLRSDLERSANEVSAQRSLREARTYFRHRTSERRNLYLCLKSYRLYRAYRRPEQRTFLPEDERKYNQAVEELTRKVRDTYDRAWIAEQNSQWPRAKEQYDLLLQYVPMSLAGDDPEVRDVLLGNVMAHMRHVSKRRGKK
ncbi:MAG: FHA domain-containing protein [Phycisphaerae bacterium]|nr:FHA domain-containing protein [Phycisphaerae bacterium]